jgi:MFS family permease
VSTTFNATFAALRHRDFRIWAAADMVSVTGTWMQVLALNWYVLQVTGSAAQMGITVMLQTLPSLFLGPIGGAIADRIRGRAALVLTQLVHAALALGLAAVIVNGSHLSVVYGFSIVGGLVASIEGPIMGRFCATLVDRAVLGNALSLGSLISSTGRILGMAIGGIVLAATGPAPLLVANAVTFLAVVGALLAIRPRQPQEQTGSAEAPRHGVRAGLAYVGRQPLVLAVLGLSLVLGSLGRNYQVTMAAMSDGPLGSGAAGYGLLSAAFAAGTVVGGLVAASRSTLGLRTLVGLGRVTSVLQISGGLAPGVSALAAIVVPVAAGAVVIDTTVATRVQLDTAWAMRGRVLGVATAVSGASGAVGAPLLGWLSETVGPRLALVSAGATTLLACLIAGAAIARLRGIPFSFHEIQRTVRTALGWRERVHAGPPASHQPA